MVFPFIRLACNGVQKCKTTIKNDFILQSHNMFVVCTYRTINS